MVNVVRGFLHQHQPGRTGWRVARLLLLWALVGSAWASAPAQAQQPAPATAPAAAPAADPATTPLAPNTPPDKPAPKLQPLPVREGEMIGDVRVKGNRRVESGSVLKRVYSRANTPLRLKAITQDIRRIWRLGYFEDIKVDATRRKDGKLVLTYIVKEKPSISAVVFEGNDELSVDDIKEVVNVKQFQILDVSKVKANAEKIRQLYLEKGYYLAEVAHRITRDPKNTQQASVTFVIREYAKVQVKKITILGNSAIPDEELRNIMATREGSWFSFITSFGNFKEDAFETDLQRITAYYYDKGYIQIKVKPPTIRLSRDKKHLYITVKVSEGPLFRVGDVDIQGDFIAKKEKLEALVKLKKGDVFSYGTLRQDLERLRAFYRDAGYAFANVNPLTGNIDEDTRQVDVTYDIQKGSKVYFGRIEIVGNTKTRDKVIRRELVIQEGKLYSKKSLDISRIRVRQLGFFEKVEIVPRRGARPDIMNVTVKVVERPTGTFQAGAGLSSTESFLANLQVSQNNLFGRGQLLTVQFQRSSLRTQLNARFYDRYFLDTPIRFSGSGYNFDFLYRDYAQTSRGGSVTFGYPLLTRLDTASDLSLSLTYKLENVTITPGGQNNRDSRQVGSLFRGGVTSSVQASLLFDSRNDRMFPTRGQFHMARAEFADDAWTLSQAEFAKIDLESRWYKKLFWQFVLRLNGQLGYVTSVDPNKPIPLQERYLVGGPQTTRGFQRFSLGPSRRVAANSSDPGTRVSDFKIGGDKRLLLTAEVEFPIFTAINLRGVVFADAGNAFGEGQGYTLVPDLFRTDENNYDDALRTAVGLGFRWFSPIGLLRFEWGFPLQRLRTEDPMVFEFSIGNAF